MLAIASSVGYAISTIMTELLARSGSTKTAILAYLGLFGFILSTFGFLVSSEFQTFSRFESP